MLSGLSTNSKAVPPHVMKAPGGVKMQLHMLN